MASHDLMAVVLFATLAAYTLLAGADFGAGIWDLLARGPRAAEERRRLAEAIGPVWEANHVWLIFFVVLLFTCFPHAFAAVSVALFWPLHLVLAGIALRGASFVFRAYGAPSGAGPVVWTRIFGVASALTPLLLGACLGAVSSGGIRLFDGRVTAGAHAWLAPFPLLVGVLALLVCAYLAGVYLAWESDGAARERFRRRALILWLVAGAVSLATLAAARSEAPRLWTQLLRGAAGELFLAGILLAPASAIALWRRRFQAARILAGAQVTILLAGWARAQWPFIIYPDLTLAQSAAPEATLRAAASTLPFGLALLAPSLWLLFSVFKGRNPRHRTGAS